MTGETTLALHPASEKNPAGKVELGFTVADVEAFYRDMSATGVLFSTSVRLQTAYSCSDRLETRLRYCSASHNGAMFALSNNGVAYSRLPWKSVTTLPATCKTLPIPGTLMLMFSPVVTQSAFF